MKKRSIIFILLTALALCACTVKDKPKDEVPASAVPTEAAADPAESASAGETAPINGRFREDGWLKILSGGATILPMEHDVPGDELVSYSGLVTEGVPLGDYLPEIYESLPVIDRSKGFELEVYEWGSIYLIDVFDASFERIAHGLSEAELYAFAAEHHEELIADVRIFVPGCEIFEEPTERVGAGYAFILSKTDKDAAREPFMRLYSAGIEVPTREFYFHSSTAFYQDGKATGMLKGDGVAFFDPDHIAAVYDELPVCNGCRVEGLDIRLSEGSKIAYIYLYDPANGFERTTLYTQAELDKFIIDSASDYKEYVVEVIVTHEGDYIEELDESETFTNSYAFIVK
ncbi:MAG: hypothetical protein J5772_07615 [Clostridia bacterium]|nr:hypothetical protein [Clostridia bacterium]